MYSAIYTGRNDLEKGEVYWQGITSMDRETYKTY